MTDPFRTTALHLAGGQAGGEHKCGQAADVSEGKPEGRAHSRGWRGGKDGLAQHGGDAGAAGGGAPHATAALGGRAGQATAGWQATSRQQAGRRRAWWLT